MTINGTSTNSCAAAGTTSLMLKRGVGAAGEPDININAPPYAIHNGEAIVCSA
jgi:alpha-glucosidase